jgi:hypothetical protein
MPIDDFFRPEEVPGNHPLLRYVSQRMKQGDEAVFELYRPREALGFRKAKIVVHFFRDGREVEYKDDDWDDDLNTWLIELGVKCRTPDEEKDRFALGLRAAFKKPEKKYGDGYFNAVLVDYVQRTDLGNEYEIKQILTHIPRSGRPEGRSYPDCVGMIEGAIKGRAAELSKKLDYEVPEAWDILAGSLARYLDERFSVTNRRLLGLM